MSKHTPGPWHTAGEQGVQIRSAKDQIAKVWTMRGNEWKANARLIAAAPELLEALKRMASIIDKMGDMPDGFIHQSPWQTLKCEEALEQARAAIAKATGEQP